ncbi:MAG: winged helix-turn-helix domain-containing protein [Thermoproteota archaeon]|nr:winged helix-turn-helix domain-containing protein [Thermoproteota archaeon]
MRYRSRTEIVRHILESANRGGGDGGITKAQILYKVSLSHAQLKEYLAILTENDFLGYDVGTETFKTTEKGHRFLEIYNGIEDLVVKA